MKTKLIGLTGGIGCGKSEVAGIFQGLGAKIIDADLIGKQVVENSPVVLEELVKVFGESILNEKRELKRKELGNMIFADPDKRKMLNRIVHPHLLKRIQDEAAEARKGSFPLIVVDAALIYEVGLVHVFYRVIVVASELQNRITRIQRRDQLSYEAVMDRIQSQMPLEEKISRADIVIHNDGTLEELQKESERVFRMVHSSE